MMWTLQQNGMDFYYPPGPEGLTPFLFQNKGDYYTKDGLQSALDQPEALSAFRGWTALYTNYHVPMYADFLTGLKPARCQSGSRTIGLMCCCRPPRVS